MHYTAGLANPVDPWLDLLQAMGISWVKLLSDVHGSGLRNAELLLSRGIMPVVRIYKHKALPDGFTDQELAIVVEFVRRGAVYIQTHNEPNLDGEWAREFWELGAEGRIDVTARQWVRDAERITAAGGIACTPPLAPGGHHDDMHFLSDFLRWLLSHGHAGLLLGGRVAIGCHNYTLNHPLDYAADSNGFLKFRFYHQSLRARLAEVGYNPALAEQVPILSLEGGATVGNGDDGNYPRVTEDLHRDWSLQMCRYMATAEPWYFCTAFWLLANRRAGHDNEMWESQAWFSDRWPGGQLPAVGALMAEPRTVRGQSMGYQVGEGFRKAEGLVGPWRENEQYHFPGTDHEVSLAVGERGVAVWYRQRNETYAFTASGEVWGDRGNAGNGTMVRLRGSDA